MPSQPEYVDHPAPSTVAVLFLLGLLVALLIALPEMIREEPILWVLFGPLVALIVFSFWPFYSTYYTVSDEGLGIRYGPWKRIYPWSDFSVAYWQKGMFATRIGWPSTTPCVRFTDAVLLKRPGKMFGLYLTPNDSKAFLARISEFAPDLTRKLIL